jgi:hypothetical protein
VTRGVPDPGDVALRRALLVAALEYGVSPLVAREAISSTSLDRDETIDLGAPDARTER